MLNIDTSNKIESYIKFILELPLDGARAEEEILLGGGRAGGRRRRRRRCCSSLSSAAHYSSMLAEHTRPRRGLLTKWVGYTDTHGRARRLGDGGAAPALGGERLGRRGADRPWRGGRCAGRGAGVRPPGIIESRSNSGARKKDTAAEAEGWHWQWPVGRADA